MNVEQMGISQSVLLNNAKLSIIIEMRDTTMHLRLGWYMSFTQILPWVNSCLDKTG